MKHTYLKAGTVKRIHVNRQAVARNRIHGTDEPVLTVQTSKGPIKARRVEIWGKHTVFDQHAKVLGCGARLYAETRAAVEVTE